MQTKQTENAKQSCAHRRSAAMMPSMLSSLLLVLATSISSHVGVNAFVPVSPLTKTKAVALTLSAARAKSSPLLEETLNDFPFAFRPDNEPATAKTVITEITKAAATKTFNELARLYGDERAQSIVQGRPMALCMNSDNFEPTLDIWGEIYGLEESKQMVERNPGLIGIPPALAAENAEATMFMSYVIAYGKPVFLGGALLSALSSALN